MTLTRSNFPKYYFALSIFCIFFNTACKAPRDNPLDSNNPENQIAILDGYIRTMSLPRTGIENAKVLFENAGVAATTDKNGYFSFRMINITSGWMKIFATGYLTDSVYVDLSSGTKQSAEAFLHFIPVIDSLAFYSTVINRYTIAPLTYLTTKFKITDKDNNIDSVFISNTELHVRKALGYDPTTKWYSTNITLSDLQLDDIEKIIGKDFSIIVKDFSNSETVIGNSQIKRVINSDITFTSPANNDSVSSAPLFTWKRFSAGYTFSYVLEVYTNEIDPQLVQQMSNISSDSISVESTTALAAGDYFWVIWVIDEFQNRTRSKPASFLVR